MAIDFSDLGAVPVPPQSNSSSGKPIDFSDLGAIPVNQGLASKAGTAIKEMFTRPAAAIKDLATNPETMANAMPDLVGTAGAISPVPGGLTMGTAAGQAIRDAALTGLGKQIPSIGRHAIELGGAIAGDVIPIPAIKGKIAGKAIGEAEQAAGVVTRAADKYPTSGTVGEVLNTLEGQIDNGLITDPSTAKSAYDITDFIHKNPQIVGKSDAIKVQAYRVGAKAQSLLNSLVPGRAAPAADFANSTAIPAAIASTWRSLPPYVKAGIQFFGPSLGLSGASYELIKALGGR